MAYKITLKYKILLIFLSIFLYSFGQEQATESEAFYIFETYDDFKQDKGTYLGIFNGISTDPFSFKIYYITPDNKKDSKVMNSLWGFKVGDYYFRYKRGRWNSPMLIRGIRGKVFYYEGELFLTMMLHDSDSGTTENTKNLVLYSDDLESDFIKIDKFSKREKDNPMFVELIPCIEKALDRYGYSAKFKSLTKCIDSFIDEEVD
ncbi:MAG: hypothetical protein R2781_11075 [Flavobacteriaceae bacterium]